MLHPAIALHSWRAWPWQGLPHGERMRIVEIGSGSGGTSAVVLAALADVGARVDFVYTDLSPQLVAHGRRMYGRRYGFARFATLDVEADVALQVCKPLALFYVMQ